MNLPPFLSQAFYNPWNVLHNPQLMDFMKQSSGPFPYNVMNPQMYGPNNQKQPQFPQNNQHSLPSPVKQVTSVPPTLKSYQQILDSIQPAKSGSEGDQSSVTVKHDKDKKKQSDQEQKQGQQSKKEKNQQPKKPKNAIVSFHSLTAGTVSSSSGIFNGKNIQFGWSAHSKTNTGFGSVGGHDNKIDQNTNVVFDNDQLDTPIDDRDKMWSPVPSS